LNFERGFQCAGALSPSDAAPVSDRAGAGAAIRVMIMISGT
jgi:hypothetical protein